jgi:DNA/RNA endonuclease YhcR with UshA esterase domain
MMNREKIIIVILIFGILGAFVGYKIYNKPHIDVAEKLADISISANEILSEFAADETTANTKFLDKIVAVKGVISETRIEKEKGIITLKTNDDFGSILCHLSAKSTKKMDKLKVGKIVIVKGICTGYLMDVILVKSEITN